VSEWTYCYINSDRGDELFLPFFSWSYILFCGVTWFFQLLGISRNMPLRMHQKRYFYTKYLQKFSKERAMPPPQTSPPVGRRTPSPHTLPSRVLRPLVPQLWKRGCAPAFIASSLNFLNQGQRSATGTTRASIERLKWRHVDEARSSTHCFNSHVVRWLSGLLHAAWLARLW